MTRALRNWATAAAAVMVLTVTFGLAASQDQAEASLKYNFGGIEGSANAQKSGDGSKVDNPADMHARGSVCCAQRRTGKLALVKPAECRAARGLVVLIAKCAQTKRVPARPKFQNITLKRGLMRGKPATPGALSAGSAQGSVVCSGGKYYPCWCSGAGTCNSFIAACVEVDGSLNCDEHNSEGQPTGCSCYK